MSYQGNKPATSFESPKKDRFTGISGTTCSLTYPVSSVADILVWVNGVKQDFTNYSVSGSTLTLGGTLVSADIVEVTYVGRTYGSIIPSDASVGLNQLSATGTASSSTFLRGDNSWASAGTTINNNADNRVITGSGTANTLEGEANLTYNGTILGVGGTGDLGTGVHIKTSDCGGGSVSANSDNLVLEENGNVGLTMLGATNGGSHLFFGHSGDEDEGFITYDNDNNRMRFGVNAGERMRIDNAGKVFIQCTQAPSSSVTGIQLADSNSASKFGGGSGTGVANLIVFYNGNGEVGKIFTNGTGTTYNTSSDYRRKENVNYTWDATTRLKQLKPARFNFKADTDTTLDGFLAHEVSSIVPDAVTGVKDETENKKNVVLNPVGDIAEEGITEAEWTQGKADGKYLANSTWHEDTDVPVYQAIDQSKLVPLLVKTVQELEARIKTLEDA